MTLSAKRALCDLITMTPFTTAIVAYCVTDHPLWLFPALAAFVLGTCYREQYLIPAEYVAPTDVKALKFARDCVTWPNGRAPLGSRTDHVDAERVLNKLIGDAGGN